jgi:hypothetical protein
VGSFTGEEAVTCMMEDASLSDPKYKDVFIRSGIKEPTLALMTEAATKKTWNGQPLGGAAAPAMPPAGTPPAATPPPTASGGVVIAPPPAAATPPPAADEPAGPPPYGRYMFGGSLMTSLDFGSAHHLDQNRPEDKQGIGGLGGLGGYELRLWGGIPFSDRGSMGAMLGYGSAKLSNVEHEGASYEESMGRMSRFTLAAQMSYQLGDQWLLLPYVGYSTISAERMAGSASGTIDEGSSIDYNDYTETPSGDDSYVGHSLFDNYGGVLGMTAAYMFHQNIGLEFGGELRFGKQDGNTNWEGRSSDLRYFMGGILLGLRFGLGASTKKDNSAGGQ